MYNDIKFADLKDNHNYLLIDVRSSHEYLDATIPGAINIPLFDNEERAVIGTIYKQVGESEAKERAIEIVSPKLPNLIKEISNSLQEGQQPIFFCWRGGMRSKTMSTLFSLLNNQVYRLEGGYRAYREYIVNHIEQTQITILTFVLHGMTGVGKTLLLQGIEAKDIMVIDLEGLAGHRGSIFGGIGAVNPVNQKQFDSFIYEKLKNINSYKALIIEAESKRIGKIMVSNNIINAKETGNHIMINASLDIRVKRIVVEYQPLKYKSEISEAIQTLKKRLPTEIRTEIDEAYADNNFEKIVILLLIHYYDPLYQYSTDKYNGKFYQINSDNLDIAVKQIIDYIDSAITVVNSF